MRPGPGGGPEAGPSTADPSTADPSTLGPEIRFELPRGAVFGYHRARFEEPAGCSLLPGSLLPPIGLRLSARAENRGFWARKAVGL